MEPKHYYCRVEDGVVKTVPLPLPPGVTSETAATHGLYPAVFMNMPHQVEANSYTQIIAMRSQLNGPVVEIWHEAVNKTDDQLENTRILLMVTLRDQRNSLLSKCDWTQLPNAPLTVEEKAAWEVYRQALRNFPANVDLSDIQWPVPPQKG